MFIESAFDIQFHLAQPTPMVAMLHLHPSLASSLRAGNELLVEHEAPGIAAGFGQRIEAAEYCDSFGNKCSRFVVPAGIVRLTGSSMVELEDATDPVAAAGQAWSVEGFLMGG